MAVNTSAFIAELNNDLATELYASGNTPLVNVLEVKVKAVVRELLTMRNYDLSGMTDEEIEADIEKYYTQCMNVARFDYNQLGAEGEETHSENGISRKYVDRQTLWSGVVPFARVGGA